MSSKLGVNCSSKEAAVPGRRRRDRRKRRPVGVTSERAKVRERQTLMTNQEEVAGAVATAIVAQERKEDQEIERFVHRALESKTGEKNNGRRLTMKTEKRRVTAKMMKEKKNKKIVQLYRQSKEIWVCKQKKKRKPRCLLRYLSKRLWEQGC